MFVLALAAAPQKAIVVSFEDPNTPQSVVDEAMKAIKDAGGVITHEYSTLEERADLRTSLTANQTCSKASQQKLQSLLLTQFTH